MAKAPTKAGFKKYTGNIKSGTGPKLPTKSAGGKGSKKGAKRGSAGC